MKNEIAIKVQHLDVNRLHVDTAKALAEIVREGTPAPTVRAFAHTLRYWQAWHQLRFAKPLPLPRAPVTLAAVLQFIADHVPRTSEDAAELLVEMPVQVDRELVRLRVKATLGVLSHNTVRHRLALLSAIHRKLGLLSPTLDGRVVELLAAADVAARNQGRSARGKPPLPESVLEQVIAACEDTPAGLRDRALLAVIYESGGRRRSEIRWLRIEDCERHPDGYILTFTRIKAKATNEVLRVPLVNAAAQALDTWLATLHAAGIESGPAFPDVRGAKRPRYSTTGLSGHAVWRIVKRRLDHASVVGDFSPHSFRSGFITDRLDRGESYAAVQAMTGHADPRTLTQHYHRPQDILNNSAARSTKR